ncbi:MAG: hypothetical protein AAGB12_15495 [Pseudomonadota bacterium]
MFKSLLAVATLFVTTANADVLETSTLVEGDVNGFINLAEGVVSNVANSQSGSRDAYIGCGIEADFYSGSVITCSAKLSSGGEFLCVTTDEGAFRAVTSITDSSYLKIETLGPLCTNIIVENGSQYGAKARAVY